MSMTYIAYTHGGECRMAYLHYASGTLDWRKYHLLCARNAKRDVALFRDTPFWLDYYTKLLAYNERAAQGYDPADIDRSGCERDAGKAGCWQVNTPEEAAAWVQMVSPHAEQCFNPDARALHLDFDNKRMTVQRDNPYCHWEDYAPDGWDVVLV